MNFSFKRTRKAGGSNTSTVAVQLFFFYYFSPNKELHRTESIKLWLVSLVMICTCATHNKAQYLRVLRKILEKFKKKDI